MRCLFCGKELALLKRLRGGGEFCSEAHRKEYQEQYEQLALARLLQAKPPAEPAAPLGSPSAPPLGIAHPIAHPGSFPVSEIARDEVPVPQHRGIAMIEAPGIEARMIEAPVSGRAEKDAGPAPMAGFVNEELVPAVTLSQHAGNLELERIATHYPSLPAGATSTNAGASPDSLSESSLPPAPRVELELSLRALDHHTRNSERGMEVREFAVPAPRMELDLRPARGTEPAGAADVMEIFMSPHPPQKATPWLGVPRGFPSAPAELGPLARLDFPTTGFAYSDSPAASQAPLASPSQAAVLTLEPPEVLPHVADPVPAPVQSAPPVEVSSPAEVIPEEPPPALVTRALPVTLHGLAASRAKLAETFTSALTVASDVQMPPSSALPLRPTIVFGPAPAPAATSTPAPVKPKPEQVRPEQVKPEQAKPEPVKQPAKPVQAKPVPEKTQSSFHSSVVPLPKSVPVKQPAVSEAVAQKVAVPKPSAPAAPPSSPRANPPVESSTAKSRESASADATIASFRLEATESGWSRLSTGLKIAIAAAVIVGLGGIGYVVTRGGSKIPEAPAPVAATPPVAAGVPISGGWIDDWAPAARPRRHISVLSGSAKLSDYRLEFQAQIETKAIGWIFRGLNPRNYYVAKLETIKPGLEPTVALVHFAVIEGQDENRVVVPLPMKVRVDTTYKIRFDAVGNHFTAWIQGEKVADWTDSRFGSGGVGFFAEQNEHAAMQGTVNVLALVPKN